MKRKDLRPLMTKVLNESWHHQLPIQNAERWRLSGGTKTYLKVLDAAVTVSALQRPAMSGIQPPKRLAAFCFCVGSCVVTDLSVWPSYSFSFLVLPKRWTRVCADLQSQQTETAKPRVIRAIKIWKNIYIRRLGRAKQRVTFQTPILVILEQTDIDEKNKHENTKLLGLAFIGWLQSPSASCQ